MWGTPVSTISHAGLQQQQQGQQQQQQEQQEAEQAQPQLEQKDASRYQQQSQSLLPQQWDVIVAADVLYEPQHYNELLDSLQQLCPSPSKQQLGHAADALQQQQQVVSVHSPPVYICFRVRRYKEDSFLSKATACGFQVTEVAVDQLHKDYQCGGYRLIRLDRE
jgi:hypothetical protein